MKKPISNVINLDLVTRLNLPANRVLEAAIDKLDRVVIMGYDNDGDFYFASSIADGGEVLWLTEAMKQHLLSMNA